MPKSCCSYNNTGKTQVVSTDQKHPQSEPEHGEVGSRGLLDLRFHHFTCFTLLSSDWAPTRPVKNGPLKDGKTSSRAIRALSKQFDTEFRPSGYKDWLIKVVSAVFAGVGENCETEGKKKCKAFPFQYSSTVIGFLFEG